MKRTTFSGRLASLLMLALTFSPVTSAHPADTNQPPFVQKPTWQETFQGSLTALLDWEKKFAPADTTKVDLTLGPWWYIGPFDNEGLKGYATVFPPEKEIAFDKTYAGKQGKQAVWKKGDQLRDGEVFNIHPFFELTEYAIAYFHRVITSPKDQELRIYFGGDDGLAVWFNGEKVIDKDVPTVASPDQYVANLKFRKGENHLLLKVVNRTGGWAYYFSTRRSGFAGPKDPRHIRREHDLWSRVQKEFSGERDRQEMARELEDRIWEPGKEAQNIGRPLRRRYAQAVEEHLEKLRLTLTGLKKDAPDLPLEKQTAACQELLKRRSEMQNLKAPEEELTRQWRECYHGVRGLAAEAGVLARIVSLRLAVLDLRKTHGTRYPADEFLARLDHLRALPPSPELEADVKALQQEALVTRNPLLQFERLLFVRRKGALGLPQNWQSNSSMGRKGYDTELCVLSPVRPDGKVTTVFKSDGLFLGDLELSFDGTKVLFSMPLPEPPNPYQVFEIGVAGKGLRQVNEKCGDFDNYDACYLPDGNYLFCSNRCVQAVPCTGGDKVALLYWMDKDGTNVRQLTFDQDHSWNPTVTPDGRILYTRWEYNDTPHYFSRILFFMNPDGTGQTECYGSNSYFPNSPMHARPIPGHPTKIVCIVSGHHGWPRMGEVVILDLAKGRRETYGVEQILPQRYRKVVPLIIDQYATGQYPTFLNPWPLSDKFFLVSCKPDPASQWGIYLVDVFDNLVPVFQFPDAAAFEPIPVQPRSMAPVMSAHVDTKRNDGIVYMQDVYLGPGLDGVPRGTVKALRIIEPIYRYWGNGNTHSIAMDGTWDVKKIYGTVPVYADGSALFRAPANTPLMVQPLNDEGMAQQVMRSWFTVMPGEMRSCVGCHESQNTAPPNKPMSQALARGVSDIRPWYGPPRGFSFEREVQPVLDRHCLRCHNGSPSPESPTGLPDFRPELPEGVRLTGYATNYGGRTNIFSQAYNSLHPYVRRAGLEADIRLPPPREWEANTSKLIQMLKKGHHKAALSREDWDRLITWIDLNVPYFGEWEKANPTPPPEIVKLRDQMRALDAARRMKQMATGGE